MDEKRKKTLENNIKHMKRERELFQRNNKQQQKILSKRGKIKEVAPPPEETQELVLSDGEGIKEEDLDFINDMVFD